MSGFRPLRTMFLVVVCIFPLLAANTGPLTRIKVDSDAPVVKLFDGIAQGQLQTRIVARDQFRAHLFVTNQSNKPLTVKVPDAVAAVHVLKQNGFFPQFPPGQNQQANQNQNNVIGLIEQGTGQDLGGQVNGANNQPFDGLFSIPPKKTMKLEFDTVCLDHGKPHPRSSMKYMLIPIEKQSDYVALQQLLAVADPDKTDRLAIQAAAWHLANGLSWKKLESKRDSELAVINHPYFTKRQLETAKSLVASAKEAAKNKPKPTLREKKFDSNAKRTTDG